MSTIIINKKKHIVKQNQQKDVVSVGVSKKTKNKFEIFMNNNYKYLLFFISGTMISIYAAFGVVAGNISELEEKNRIENEIIKEKKQITYLDDSTLIEKKLEN